MADRSVVVKLRAEIADYKTKMAEAAKSTEGLGKSAAKSEQQTRNLANMQVQAGREMEQETRDLANMQMQAAREMEADQAESARKQADAWNTVGTALLGVGVAAAAGVTLAVSKFADFDQAMSSVDAATHETTTNMGLLREAAIKAGADTQYSATEAAAGIEELAKAGVTTKDILAGGLSGALSLAAAGNLAVADAAEIAATAVTTFNLEGSDVPHIADLMAAGAGKAQGSVEDLGNALKQSALVADQTGLSIEETTGGLAAFAAAGLIGSDAGTSFKAMLQRLTPQSDEAAGAMDDLGISAYDSQGNFIGLANFAGNLKDSLKALTPEQRNSALATIFGSDAVRAASVLYEQGEAGITKWTEAVNDQGYAAETAARMTDNLKGDIERLGGSLDTALIQTGSGANAALREITQGLTDLINGFAAAPAGAQNTVLAVGAITAGVGLLGGAFLLAAPKIVATKTALTTMGISARTAAVGVGVVGGALAVATIGLGVWATAQAEAAANVAALAETLDATTGALTEMSRENITASLSSEKTWMGFLKVSDSAYDNARKLGIGLGLVTEAASGNGEAMSKVNDLLNTGTVGSKSFEDALRRTGLTSGEYAAAQGQLQDSLKGSNSTLDEAVKVTLQKNEADTAAAGGLEDLAEGYDFTTGAIEGQKDSLTELLEVQAEAAGVVLSERDAQRNLEAAYDGVDAAIEQQISTLATHLESLGQTEEAARKNAEAEVAHADKLDITTEAGRANQAALDDISASGWDLIEAMKANDASQESIQKTMQVTRDRFIVVAQKMGLSKDAAVALADKLNLIPANVRSQVQIDTENADKALSEFLNKNRKITIGTGFAGKDSKLRAAEGGAISGPGTGTSDSIPALLSDGEHVITAAEVTKAGGQGAIYQMRRGINDGSLKFAQGGGVSLSPIKDTWAHVGIDATAMQAAFESFAKNNIPDGFGGGTGANGGTGSSLVAFGRMLQQMGFSVGEHPLFGGVHGGHMVGSKHYRAAAIDVNHGAGTSASEQRAIDGIIPLSRSFGLGHIWRAPGHEGHAHFEYDQGGMLPPGYTSVYNGTGKPEAVFTEKQLAALTAGNGGAGVKVNLSGTFYSYDPHAVAREANNRMQDAMAAYGIGR